MGRYSSDSESEPERKRSSKKSKKKSKSRRRSRSSSYDTGRSRDSRRKSRSDSRGRSRSTERRRRSKSRDDRRRRHRSRSEDSYRSRRSHRRSRTRSPRRRRSRSRSDSRDDRYSRRHSSRSRSRERSSSKRNKKKKRSRSREHSSKKEKATTEKTKDPCESIPGFAEMTPAEQSKLRIQAAFDAVEASTSKAMEATSSSQAENTFEQIERSQVLQDIEDDDFIPTHFSSSRSTKPAEAPKPLSAWPKTLAEQEDFHEMAIFGSTKALALDEKVRKEISDAAEPLIKTRIKWEDRDPETLAHDSLKISKEEAEHRWVDKLNEMRRQHLIEMGIIKS